MDDNEVVRYMPPLAIFAEQKCLELESDDTLFTLEVPVLNLFALIQEWRTKMYHPRPFSCYVNGCYKETVAHADYFFLCSEHHKIHMGYLTRLYKNAEKSIARTLCGYARTRPPGGGANSMWLSHGVIRDINERAGGNPALYSDYLKFMKAMFLNIPGWQHPDAWESFASVHIYPLIMEMVRKAYFYRYLAALSIMSDTGHLDIVDMYAMFLSERGDIPYRVLQDSLRNEWIVIRQRHVQGFSAQVVATETTMCAFCTKKEAEYHDPVTLGKYCSDDCRIDCILSKEV